MIFNFNSSYVSEILVKVKIPQLIFQKKGA